MTYEDGLIQRADLALGIKKLDVDQIMVLLLHLEGYTYEEIAERIYTSKSSVHRIKVSAEEKLSEFLG